MSASINPQKADITVNKSLAIPPYLTKWLDNGQDLVKNSPTVLNDYAKYLIGLVSAIITIYTGGLALLGVSASNLYYPYSLLLVIPYVPWLFCIYKSVELLNPEHQEFPPDDIKKIKRMFESMSVIKYKKLKLCVNLFLIGIVAAIICLVALPVIAGSTGHSVQFFIPENNAPTLDSLTLTVDPITHRTATVQLLEVTDYSYKVKLNNGNIISFSKSLASGFFYMS